MKNNLASFVVGIIFAVGLGLSGMTQPQKVIGFLDIFGNWDPSLIFVMFGAIGVHFVAYRITRRRQAPVLATQWDVPERTDITPALIAGSFIFGIGWGIGGYCPGPAISALASFDILPAVFVGAMIVGMFAFNLINQKLKLKK